jgi:uncharacterized membrane protein YtjA (UPF0391 family)
MRARRAIAVNSGTYRAVAAGMDAAETTSGRASRAAPRHSSREARMLRYAAIFFVIALVAALFGFGGIAAGAAEIAKVLFFIFVILFLVSLVWGLIAGNRSP